MTLTLLNYPGKRHYLSVLSAALILLATFSTQAAPWIDPGNERIRHHIQHLADSGQLNIPVSTWPLTWVSVKAKLDAIESDVLSDSQRWSYNFLQHELDKATRRLSFKKHVRTSNDSPSITSFNSDSRQKNEAQFSVDFVGNYFSYRAQVNYVNDPLDFDPKYTGTNKPTPRKTRFDGSFIAGLWGNWALGGGAIDRWWGPGWQSSMILSHNARPAPGLFIQRNNPSPFKTPLLRWLGPWQMTTFMNQLEKQRGTPKTLLWGMRVTFKPLHSLEIGLSRTAQWGGDGRPQNLDIFTNLLLGKDNRGDDGVDEKVDLQSNEPGNQLAGVDWRWGLSFKNVSGAFYGQFIGEDEAGGAPSRGIGMAGMESGFSLFGAHSRLAIETSNSIMSFYDDPKRYKSTYNHPLYPSGYKHYQRSIASSYDGDSTSITLRGDHFLTNGHQLSWQYSKLKLNAKNDPRYSFAQLATDNLQLSYHLPMTEHIKASIGFSHFSDAIVFNRETIDSSIFVSLTSIF